MNNLKQARLQMIKQAQYKINSERTQAIFDDRNISQLCNTIQNLEYCVTQDELINDLNFD